jgi:deazaflavin-dependent oxidoreductase (nitroreductase family)
LHPIVRSPRGLDPTTERNDSDDDGVGPCVIATLDLFPHAGFRAFNSVVGPFTKRGIGAPPLVGIGTVTIATTGRRSGRAREVPLAAARVGDTVVVSTVRGNSQWVKNLESDPTTTIWLDGCARHAEASVQRLPGLTVATLRANS